MPVTEQITLVLGEHTFRLTPLGAKAGLRVFGQLLHVAGPTLAALLEQENNLLEVSGVDLAKAAREIAQRDLAGDLLAFWSVFEPQTEVSKDGSTWMLLGKVTEVLFVGKVQHMLRLLWAHLEVNYRGFFDDCMMSATVLRPGKGASPSPTTLIGGSGA